MLISASVTCLTLPGLLVGFSLHVLALFPSFESLLPRILLTADLKMLGVGLVADDGPCETSVPDGESYLG